MDELETMQAEIERLRAERVVLLTAYLELHAAIEVLANHAARVFQALGIKSLREQ